MPRGFERDQTHDTALRFDEDVALTSDYAARIPKNVKVGDVIQGIVDCQRCVDEHQLERQGDAEDKNDDDTCKQTSQHPRICSDEHRLEREGDAEDEDDVGTCVLVCQNIRVKTHQY